MSKQLKEIQDNIDSIESMKADLLESAQVITFIFDDLQLICEDYKTKKDATN